MAKHHMTTADFQMLKRVEAGDVTWNEDARGRISYRLWSDEHTYVTCTPRLKRLDSFGLIDRWRAAGYTHAMKGGVDLSVRGCRLRAQARGESRPDGTDEVRS